MSAAVHRLDFPRSAFTPEQREEILRSAQAHVANRAQDQRDLADRLMRQPIEEGLAKYRREAAEAEAAELRAAEQREREQHREQQRSTKGWSDWLTGEIDRRLGEYAGRQRSLTDELLKLFERHNGIFEKAADRFDAIKAENTALRGELAKARADHAVAFERLTARIAELERAATQAAIATSAGLRKVGDDLAEITSSKMWKAARDWWGA
jgi:chromosome segregation ATPase